MDARSRAADLLALVPAAAIPLLFLHSRYQAHTTVGALDVYSSDVAVAVVVLVALYAGFARGWRPLRRPLVLWCVAAALLLLFVVACFWRPLEQTTNHLVTAAKVWEYALLAPAVTLLVRRRVDVDRLLAVFVAWSVAASGWGVLQFLGLVNEFRGRRPGQLETSFLGNIDFAAFSGATLAIGFAGIALGTHRRLAVVALVSGAVGAVLGAQVFPYAGMVLAAAACLLVAYRTHALSARRAVVVCATVVVVGVGVLALRSYDTANFLRFLGIRPASTSTSTSVQTGSQRTMLTYIGLRIWEDHPLLGVGFERSENRYQPYLAAAKRKFPNQPEQAYPSPSHPWGIQDLWVQLLADTGVVGFVLGVATFVVALARLVRTPLAVRFVALVAAGWLLVAVGGWTGLGIVAGIPLQAVTWLGIGLAAAARELA
jgi:O-antigen ligase/polysaccharide polymerase Wzy-like membrane protein